jgi:nicotinate dehydrogenase subunit A
MHSCDVPLWDCAGKNIVTIEGIATPDNLHALQQAFIDEQAAQCGYCVSGILMTAKALLDENPSPTESEIREALDRNLCRCGTHNRFVRAIQKVAAQGKGSHNV